MNPFNSRGIVLAAVFGAWSLPLLASSTASTTSVDGLSASVGSVSGSIDKSSNSMVKTVTAGDYKVVEVAKAAGRPGLLRMTLQPVADNSADSTVWLYVPAPTLTRHPLHAGQVITARARPYGTEFAYADTGKAFFLVLADNWYRELQTNLVTL